MSIKQPVTQKRLTNVAIVRLKSHSKKFEIACYKNKVMNWREGIEKDLAEVLQTETIFTNVSRAIVANDKDLKKAFGTTNSEEICRKILKSGDLQVSEKEREVQLESVFRDIVQLVVERCVHPQTGRQLTASSVENALKSIGYSVLLEQPAKKQSLKAIEALCTELPESFVRAKMRLRITCPSTLLSEIKGKVEAAERVHFEEAMDGSAGGSSGSSTITFLCDPNQYREFDNLATSFAADGASLHVVTAAVLRESGDIHSGMAQAPATASAAREPAKAVQPAVAPTKGASASQPQDTSALKKGPKCSACAAVFEDAAEYRKHCRSEWHNYNLKRKVKSLPPVTEEEFVEISLDVREGFLGAD
mmetsp:Transcript_66940/g.131938  ORF Transcript_66940/g.131938 Transcript_66940/m.131938 type:complete len:362 (-) Transcript_66940:82-1167(-)|eukprot:CAMPEP_0172861406 /NCGR_PEP_ID=MMETSP1075-20121228/72641_1 /TAXON_ID=2916 /ORGANISM="Ceratium fusus, Strain PA161109" /LENGTH=361 /DNA_ID=CAMNT_0013709539 /DNA_START=66 /DNA_END=1151 /DNA_ORIENTATION=-